MKILFWNIGKDLSDRKLDLISEAIATECPDIFCVAEGSHSIENCNRIIEKFDAHQYFCYYSPLFYRNEELKLTYKYNSNGLKIFTKTKNIPSERFSFYMQREEGRIVILKTFINYTSTTFVFLHNFSKAGNYQVTIEQHSFIGSLVDMLEIGNVSGRQVSNLHNRTVIIGDFNMEPWDDVLRNKRYLSTYFFPVHNSIVRRKNRSFKIYFNPLAELIFQSRIENLGGTYYNDNYGWALFDYILFDTSECDITYNVITEFQGGSKLLNIGNHVTSSFLKDDLDHLPIVTKFNS